jgi:hypothetical protein
VKKITVLIIGYSLTGCALLPPQSTPKGCLPPPSQSQLPAAKVSEVTQPYSSTLMRLEDGRFTYPIPNITKISTFRTNLNKAIRQKHGAKKIGDDGLVDATDIKSSHSEKAAYQASVSEAAKMSALSGIAVTTTLMSIETILDDLLNRANSMISSQLFAMRSHVAATISDINVAMRDQMQDGYDKLNEQQRQMLDRAMLLADQAQRSLDKLASEGAFAASDLLCQTTVNFANYPNTIIGLGLPFERCFAPDILCLSSLEVRDVGTPQAEQMLQFRGVNLMPNDEYADATLLVGGKQLGLPTAGGKSILQMPLPGGLNGKVGDTSLRGPLMARVDFNWPNNEVARRWFFELKPFAVRSVDVTFGFEIEGPVRTIREQQCEVSAPGGTFGGREETATCTIVPDDTKKSIESCEESPPSSANGDAGIRNRLFSVGACTWELHARSKPYYGAGAWYVFNGRAHQVAKQRIPGPNFTGIKILNQNEKSWVIDYPVNLVPSEYQIIEGRARYNAIITDNEGNTITLTEAKPSDPKFGSATVIGKRLTINLP